MSVTPGQTLGQYRIEESIGAGGMGEVFRARDTKLGRDVALKVLPQTVANDPHVLARFEREARAIAAVSHPNILAIHDFVTGGEASFVVTELLQGETLRDRLTQGALAPRKAADLGRQVARGLAAAHDAGIVHRDMKPENLFLTEDGRIKILDFGLATDKSDATGHDKETEAATRTSLTAPGTVLGTVGYMSPEQVRGEATDNRSDIFSFGAVLYEMVTGARPFVRDTHAETMTAILKEEPPETGSAPPGVPPAFSLIVRRCLEKRVGERFQSAHDLAFSLEALSSATVTSGSTAAVTGVSEPRWRRGAGLLVGLAALGLIVGAVATYFLLPRPVPSQPPTFTSLSTRRGTVTNARFEPGTEAAVYSAAWDGGPLMLYPSRPGTRTSDPLSIGEADLLSVSSTGELALSLERRYPLGWEAIGTLAVARPGGAAPRRILEDVLVADWSPDGQDFAVAREVDGVVRLEYPIGTVLHESEGWISRVRVNPDGNRVLFADNPVRGDNYSIPKIVDRSGVVDVLDGSAAWGLLWAPDGETAWAANGRSLWAVRPGEPRRRIYEFPSIVGLLDVDPTGRVLLTVNSIRREMLVLPPGASEEVNLSWLDWSTPWILSPDGTRVVFEEGNVLDEGGYAIFMRDTNGDPPLLLGYGSVMAASPDGKHMAIVRNTGDTRALTIVPTGAGEARTLDIGELEALPRNGSWIEGPLGNLGELVFVARNADGVEQFYRLPLDGGVAPQPVTPPDFVIGIVGHVVAPDSKSIIVSTPGGPAVRFPIEGGDPDPVPGLLETDLPLRFETNGRYLFVQAAHAVPCPIIRIDTQTGERTLWRELSPLDPAGVSAVDKVSISADGSAHMYSNKRIISQLILTEGLGR
jgi:serine/threonine protein kinase